MTYSRDGLDEILFKKDISSFIHYDHILCCIRHQSLPDLQENEGDTQQHR